MGDVCTMRLVLSEEGCQYITLFGVDMDKNGRRVW